MENREEYQPVALAIEGALSTEFPLMDGRIITRLADSILEAVDATGVLTYLPTCTTCRSNAVWGTDRCIEHQED